MHHHHDRRSFLTFATWAGISWLTPLATQLARANEKTKAPAQSLIILWMQGGPSQLETFDPKPTSIHGGGTKSIPTNVKGIEIAEGLPLLAEQMDSLAIVRSMVSKEGDHERGTYTVKTGFRPDPTVVHPSLGAIACHELPTEKVEIPRHISILSSEWPAKGGFLGDKYNAFLADDPAGPVENTKSYLTPEREAKRFEHLNVIEAAFAKGRQKQMDATGHRATVADARKMMSSEQLKAFDVSLEPLAVRKKYGDTEFGRGCLAARRLIEVGVRCVEVTLSGWDTHINNKNFCAAQNKILDPAFAALLAELKERKLLDKTLVVFAGEFGRTPTINPAGGRDHWPTGFSVALAGGGIRGGQVLGETNLDAIKPEQPGMMMAKRDEGWKDFVNEPVSIENLNATILAAMGINHEKLSHAVLGRTVKYSEGEPVAKLLKD
jgi:uncharacterized protein (DUF1501 family)